MTRSFTGRRAVLLSLLACTPVFAQTEGHEFIRLASSGRTATGPVEVIEFFAYSCPHCYRFDSGLSAWVKKNASRIRFRRIHVETRGFELHQALYCALEANHVDDSRHLQVFRAFHDQGNLLRSERGIRPLWKDIGLDPDDLAGALASKDVEQRIDAARQVQRRFGITQWPAAVVGNALLTNPALASSGEAGADEARASTLTLQAMTRMLDLSEQGQR